MHGTLIESLKSLYDSSIGHHLESSTLKNSPWALLVHKKRKSHKICISILLTSALLLFACFEGVIIGNTCKNCDGYKLRRLNDVADHPTRIWLRLLFHSDCNVRFIRYKSTLFLRTLSQPSIRQNPSTSFVNLHFFAIKKTQMCWPIQNLRTKPQSNKTQICKFNIIQFFLFSSSLVRIQWYSYKAMNSESRGIISKILWFTPSSAFKFKLILQLLNSSIFPRKYFLQSRL